MKMNEWKRMLNLEKKSDPSGERADMIKQLGVVVSKYGPVGYGVLDKNEYNEIMKIINKTIAKIVTENSLNEVKVKTLDVKKGKELGISEFPNFSATGSVKGMKDKYYGKDALLVKCGSYIYNVSSEPDIYYKESK